MSFIGKISQENIGDIINEIFNLQISIHEQNNREHDVFDILSTNGKS